MPGQRAKVETEISKWTAACVVGSHFVVGGSAVVTFDFFVMRMLFLINQREAPRGLPRVQRSAG